MWKSPTLISCRQEIWVLVKIRYVVMAQVIKPSGVAYTLSHLSYQT